MGMTLLVFAGGGNLPGFEHASQSRCLRVCNRGCRLTRSTKSSTTCACAVSFRSARIGRRSRVRTGTSTSSCVKAPARLATSGSSPSSWSAFASSGNGSGTSTSCSPASSLSRSGRRLARGRASSGRATVTADGRSRGRLATGSRPSARSRRRRRCVSTHRHLHFPYRSPADSSRAAGLRYAVLVACPHEVSALLRRHTRRSTRAGALREASEACAAASTTALVGHQYAWDDRVVIGKALLPPSSPR